MEKPVGVESLAERGIVPAGMVGAVVGAVGAIALAASVGTAHEAVCGTAGAMFGSAAVALGWWAVATLGGTIFAPASPRHRAPRAEAHAVRHA